MDERGMTPEDSEWTKAWAIVEPFTERRPYIWPVLYKIVDTKMLVKAIYAPDKYASEWPGIHSISGDIRMTHDVALDALQALIRRKNKEQLAVPGRMLEDD